MSMELIRSLFVFRWKPVRRKPAPYNPIQRTLEYYKRAFSWIRRHWKLTLILVFVLPVVIGMFFRFTGTFGIYEDYGVEPKVQPKEGGIWDFIWGDLRGQPPGWETDPDGILPIKKITGEGLNGPINPIFIPLEFWLVDLMVYVPAFLLGGIDWATNLDIVPGYLLFPLGMLYQRFLFFGGPGLLAVLVAALIITAFILLIPLIIGFYSVPILEFLFVNSISIIKLIVLVSILFAIILVPIAILNPEALQKFLGG